LLVLLREIKMPWRHSIALALGSIGPADEVGPAFAEMARSLADARDDGELRRTLQEALHKLGPGVSGEVAKLLEDDRPEVRRFASEVLAGFGRGAKDALPALRAALDDKDVETAVSAAQAVALIEPRAECVPPLVRGLKAPDARLRQRAAEVLQRLGPVAGDAVPALQAAMQDPDPVVGQAAGSALRAIDPAAANRAGKR
jgi:hypothetical protein